MSENTTFNDEAMIEEALRRMRSKGPGIPSEKVQVFIAKIGKEIERSDRLRKECVEQLLRQLKSGEL